VLGRSRGRRRRLGRRRGVGLGVLVVWGEISAAAAAAVGWRGRLRGGRIDRGSLGGVKLVDLIGVE
jgi:hypothetical protein